MDHLQTITTSFTYNSIARNNNIDKCELFIFEPFVFGFIRNAHQSSHYPGHQWYNRQCSHALCSHKAFVSYQQESTRYKLQLIIWSTPKGILNSIFRGPCQLGGKPVSLSAPPQSGQSNRYMTTDRVFFEQIPYDCDNSSATCLACFFSYNFDWLFYFFHAMWLVFHT